MTRERNYLRMLNVRDLTLLASEQFTTDLELVLAERLAELADVDASLEAAQAAIEDLTEDRDYWELVANARKEDLEALQAQLDATQGYGPDE
jgi:hypothetical protein